MLDVQCTENVQPNAEQWCEASENDDVPISTISSPNLISGDLYASNFYFTFYFMIIHEFIYCRVITLFILKQFDVIFFLSFFIFLTYSIFLIFYILSIHLNMYLYNESFPARIQLKLCYTHLCFLLVNARPFRYYIS